MKNQQLPLEQQDTDREAALLGAVVFCGADIATGFYTNHLDWTNPPYTTLWLILLFMLSVRVYSMVLAFRLCKRQNKGTSGYIFLSVWFPYVALFILGLSKKGL